MVRQIIETAHHRNGVSGRGFSVVRFVDDAGRNMLGVVFDDSPTVECVTAVFDLDLLKQDVIAFGENSWRGDHYQDTLQTAIQARWPFADYGPEVGIPVGTPAAIVKACNRQAANILMGAE
jgi:hypothetical protein